MIGFKRRTGRLVAATLAVSAMALVGCADSGQRAPAAAARPGRHQRLRPDHRGLAGRRPGVDPGGLLGRQDQAAGQADPRRHRLRPAVLDQGPGHGQGHRLRRRARRDAVPLHHRQDRRRRRRARGHHGGHPRDADPERHRRRGVRHVHDHPGAGQEGGVRGPVLQLRCRDHGQGRRRFDQEGRRPQRQDGGHGGQLDRGARAAEVRAAGHPAPVPGGRAVRGGRAAGPGRGLRARPGDPDLRRQHEPGRQGGGGAVHPGALRDRRCPSPTRPPSSSSTTGSRRSTPMAAGPSCGRPPSARS